MASRNPPTKPQTKQALEGEGSYSATRSYNRHLASALADKASIRRGAELARRAVEGPEGPALRAAEKKAKAGPRPRAPAKRPRG